MGRGIFFLIVGTLIVWPGYKLANYACGLYSQGKASETWVPVEATVSSFKFARQSSARAGRRSGGNVSNPHVNVVYHYAYDGVEYTGDRTGFGPYSKGKLERPRRGKATVYVDPENPADSVYIKGVSLPNLGGLGVAVAMILAGLFFIGSGLKSILGGLSLKDFRIRALERA